MVWHSQEGKGLLQLIGHARMVIFVTYSPDGKRILTGSYDGTAKMWDAEKGTELFTLKGHAGAGVIKSFSPDGKLILTGDKGVAKVWDAENGHELLTLRWDSPRLDKISFNKDGSKVLVWEVTGGSMRWDVTTGQPIVRDRAGQVLAWDSITGQPVASDVPPQQPLWGVAVPATSPDGRYVAKPSGLTVKLVDLEKATAGSPWPLPDAAGRKAYHSEQAALAEKKMQWFAVAFHLGRLLLDDPDNADLKQRHSAAIEKSRSIAK